ncbi:MAG: hypothetical protein WCK34_15360 [Bacteroidota bacterium]
MQHKVIDLARLLNKEMPVYPDTAPPSFDFTNTVVKDGPGTSSVDALPYRNPYRRPCHILSQGRSLDQFPVDKFTGSAMVIDCRGRDEISLEYLQKFESKNINGWLCSLPYRLAG